MSIICHAIGDHDRIDFMPAISSAPPPPPPPPADPDWPVWPGGVPLRPDIPHVPSDARLASSAEQRR